MADASRALLPSIEEHDDLANIEKYIAQGGYETLKRVIKEMSPDDVTNVVKEANIKGRGGAGFPAGQKWSMCADRYPRYVLANADESEPGSFKDRKLLEGDPHRVIEGMILTSYALGVNLGYIYMRGEFFHIYDQVEHCLLEAREKGFLGKNILGSDFSLDIYPHPGAGAYICGEETGLIESLEGNRPYPRLKPPFFPAAVGLWGQPTILNNVETFSDVTLILKNGAEWFLKLGTEDTSGTRLIGVSGHVKSPGLYELSPGITLREVIYDVAGGIRGDRQLKAVIPGGISAPVLTPDEIDTTMELGKLGSIGTMGGTGGVIVMDETVSIIDVMLNASNFARHESCGQCTPCREGTPWMNDILRRIHDGDGRIEDIALLLDICVQIHGRTVCPFGMAPAVWPIKTFLIKYYPEIKASIEQKKAVVLPVEQAYLKQDEGYEAMGGPGNFRLKEQVLG
ncbi:MAG: NADH-quinone oxidoreductase subunit NuoF [Candidatus Latescibacteria bacterium]|jgi:NADH-quinone oxidoreductase subunit F|nr:NADH-quinone oxidoreductase subunit NuoF [Candidatus Latescibacterota bacterium]